MESLFWNWLALGLGLLGTLVFSLVLCGICQAIWGVLRRFGPWQEPDTEVRRRGN